MEKDLETKLVQAVNKTKTLWLHKIELQHNVDRVKFRKEEPQYMHEYVPYVSLEDLIKVLVEK